MRLKSISRALLHYLGLCKSARASSRLSPNLAQPDFNAPTARHSLTDRHATHPVCEHHSCDEAGRRLRRSDHGRDRRQSPASFHFQTRRDEERNFLKNKGLSVNRPLGIAPDFEADLVARIEQNRRRSSATSRILRLRRGKSRPKAGCERKGVILRTSP